MQGELLDARMRRFRKQRWGWTGTDAGLEPHLAKEAQAEQALQRQIITTLTEAELRTAVRHEHLTQQRRVKREQDAAARMKGPSPGW